MYQLVGSLLALFAILTALSEAPVAGTLFALSTFMWVLFAKPRRRALLVRAKAPWGAVHEVRYAR